MAVVDKYVSSNIQNDKLESAALLLGNKMVAAIATFEVAEADDDGSVYRIFKDIPGNLIPFDIRIVNDAIANATDYDLGIYRPNLGAVIDVNVFMDAENINGGNSLAAPAFALSNVDVADLTKTIAEHAGHDVTDSLMGYDIAITAATVGTAAGTITVVGLFVQG